MDRVLDRVDRTDRVKCCKCGEPADAVEKDYWFYCAKCWLKRLIR